MRIDPLIQRLRAVLKATAIEVSRYDLLDPVEAKRAKMREYKRKERERHRIEVLIPRRQEMCRRMQNGDREAARWWGHYEMSCKGKKPMRALGFPNLRKGRETVERNRARRKREKEAATWANSL